MNLKSFAQRRPMATDAQAHRGVVLNMDDVKRCASATGGNCQIQLEDGFSITASTPRAQATRYKNAAALAISFPGPTERHRRLPQMFFLPLRIDQVQRHP